jgi:hypothetical protein
VHIHITLHKVAVGIKYVNVSKVHRKVHRRVSYYCNTKTTSSIATIIIILLISLTFASSLLVKCWSRKSFILESPKREYIRKDKSRKSLNF